MSEQADIEYLHAVRAVVEDRVLENIGNAVATGPDVSRLQQEFLAQQAVNKELIDLAIIPLEGEFTQ